MNCDYCGDEIKKEEKYYNIKGSFVCKDCLDAEQSIGEDEHEEAIDRAKNVK